LNKSANLGIIGELLGEVEELPMADSCSRLACLMGENTRALEEAASELSKYAREIGLFNFEEQVRNLSI